MTLQQLEYIIAVNKHRQFVKASKECGVTQPTLSQMIQKLETELNVVIFDRSKHPIEPTDMGQRLIQQAEVSLREVRKMKEMILTEVESLSGPLKVAVIPTLAPYIVPSFIEVFTRNYAQVDLSVSEMTTGECIQALKLGTIDLCIAATPLQEDDLFEIPLYYERFVAYFSQKSNNVAESLSAKDMPKENLWVLEEGHCMRNQTFNFCQKKTEYNQSFQSGSIETLIRTVDHNGGYSVIPEMHHEFLTEKQKENIRVIDNPPAVREVSIVITKDFIKERLINAVADTIKEFIPEGMLDQRLKKFSIRL